MKRLIAGTDFPRIEREIENGRRAVFTVNGPQPYNFNLWYYEIKVYVLASGFDFNKPVDYRKPLSDYYVSYIRRVVDENFTEQEYKDFIDKFVNDISYRDQFKKDTWVKSDSPCVNGGTDEQLIDVVNKFNQLGFTVERSCQGGQGTEFQENPKMTGHSPRAFITFKDEIPNKLRKMIFKYRELTVGNQFSHTVEMKYPAQNQNFPSIMNEIIQKIEKDSIKEAFVKRLIKKTAIPHLVPREIHPNPIQPLWESDYNARRLANELLTRISIVPTAEVQFELAQDIDNGRFDDLGDPQQNFDAWVERTEQMLRRRGRWQSI